MAFRLLDKKKIPYKKIVIDGKPHLWDEIFEKTGRDTVPQIFINSTHIGGFDDLQEAEFDGKLDEILAK
jgi:glutaredoxin 3